MSLGEVEKGPDHESDLAGEGSRMALVEKVKSQDEFLDDIRRRLEDHQRQKQHLETQLDKCIALGLQLLGMFLLFNFLVVF